MTTAKAKTFFTFRYWACLLAITLAITPILDLNAANVAPASSLTIQQANIAINGSDPAVILQTAGYGNINGLTSNQSNNLLNSLVALFATSRGVNRSTNATKSETLFNNYASAANNLLNILSSLDSQSSVADVQNAITILNSSDATSPLGALATLMGAVFPNLNRLASKNWIYPFTKQRVMITYQGESLNQSVANGFVAEFVALRQQLEDLFQALQVAMLLAGAQALDLNPATPQAMQAVIDASGCSTQTSLDQQISCASSWYGAQQVIISNITQDIGAITTATGVINNGVSSITQTINNNLATYASQISSATNSTSANTAYNSGLAQINSAYASLLGASGVINVQTNLVGTQKSNINANLAQLNAQIFASQINQAQNALNQALNNFNQAVSSANSAFPANLPAALDNNGAQNFSTSVPGVAILKLYADLQAILKTFTAANQISVAMAAINNSILAINNSTQTLNSAVSTATNNINQIVTTYSAQINSAQTTADVQVAYNNGLGKINSVYANLIGAQGVIAAQTNLVSAQQTIITNNLAQLANQNLGAQLTTLQAQIAAANSDFTKSLSQASIAFPASLPATLDNNSAQQFSSSVPGSAILTLYNLYNGKQSVTGPVGAVPGVVSSLNQILTAATNNFSQDLSVALAAIVAAQDVSGVNSALIAGIAKINSDYTQLIATNNYNTALATAISLQKQLAALPVSESVTDALQSLNSVVVNVNQAIPTLAAGIVFTAANAASTYQDSLPGKAINTMNSFANIGQNILNMASAIQALNGNIVNVTTNINEIAANYVKQLLVATDMTSATALYNQAIDQINSALSGMLGANGTIANQVGALNTQQTNINAALENVSNQLFASEIASLQAAFNGVKTSLGSLLNTINQSFPQGLPLTLDSNSAQNYGTSVPGAAVLLLYANLLSLNSTVAGQALQSALTAVAPIFNQIQTQVVSTINNAQTTSDTEAAVTTGVAQINTNYQTTVTDGSNYDAALGAAQTVMQNLVALAKNDTADSAIISKAQQNITSILNNANTSLPTLLPADISTGFTVTNITNYPNSLPSGAIAAIASAKSAVNSKLDEALEISAALIAVLGILAKGAVEFADWLKSKQAQQEIDNDTKNVVEGGDTNGDGTGITEEQAQEINTAIQEDIQADPSGETTFNLDALLSRYPAIGDILVKYVGNKMADALDISSDNRISLGKLIGEKLTVDSVAGFRDALKVTNDTLNSFSDQGFTPDDVLTMVNSMQTYGLQTEMNITANISELGEVILGPPELQKGANDVTSDEFIAEFKAAAQAQANTEAISEAETKLDISSGNDAAFEDLIRDQSGYNADDSIAQQVGSAEEMLSSDVPNGYTVDDIMTIVADINAYGATNNYNTAQNIAEVVKIINGNPPITKNSGDDVGSAEFQAKFKAGIAAQADAEVISEAENSLDITEENKAAFEKLVQEDQAANSGETVTQAIDNVDAILKGSSAQGFTPDDMLTMASSENIANYGINDTGSLAGNIAALNKAIAGPPPINKGTSGVSDPSFQEDFKAAVQAQANAEAISGAENSLGISEGNKAAFEKLVQADQAANSGETVTQAIDNVDAILKGSSAQGFTPDDMLTMAASENIANYGINDTGSLAGNIAALNKAIAGPPSITKGASGVSDPSFQEDFKAALQAQANAEAISGAESSLGISEGNSDAFNKLVQQDQQTNLGETLADAIGNVDAILKGSSAQGFTPDDILTMASSDNIGYYEISDTGTLSGNIAALNKVINGTPPITKASGDVVNSESFQIKFKSGIVAQANAEAISGAEGSLGISPANRAAFEKLLAQDQTENPQETIDLTIEDVTNDLQVLQEQGFTADDVLTMASDSAYLPDGFNGTIQDAVRLINGTISRNQNINKTGLTSDGSDNIADPALQGAMKYYTTSVQNTGKLPLVQDGISIGGAGGSQNIPGAAAFDDAANSEAGETKTELQDYIKANALTKSGFKGEIDDLYAEKYALEEDASENEDSIKAIDNQIAQGEEVLDDPATPFAE